MRGSFIILACFVGGLLAGYFGLLPAFLHTADYTRYILAALLFCIGLNIGSDKKLVAKLKQTKPKILLVPLGTIVGTLLGTAAVSFLLTDVNPFEAMAVGSGFGYYSLSSILLKDISGVEMSTMALSSNIIRELSTLIIAPILVKYFGKFAPISSAGATSMDTCLPIISQYSGTEFVFIAIVHGIALDLSVPFLVPLMGTLGVMFG